MPTAPHYPVVETRKPEESIMTATLDTQALKELDQAHHLHPFTDFEDYAQHGGRIVSRAEHVYIYDSDGNKIQDRRGPRVQKLKFIDNRRNMDRKFS